MIFPAKIKKSKLLIKNTPPLAVVGIFYFAHKKQILELASKIEEQRNLFCYGKEQTQESIAELIHDFNELKKKFREAGFDEF